MRTALASPNVIYKVQLHIQRAELMVPSVYQEVNVAKLGAMSVYCRVKSYGHEWKTVCRDGDKPVWNEVGRHVTQTFRVELSDPPFIEVSVLHKSFLLADVEVREELTADREFHN